MIFRRHLVLGAAAVLMSVGLVSCTIEPRGASSQENREDAAAPAVAPEISVQEGDVDVDPLAEITVSSAGQGLESVVMLNDAGNEVESELSADAKTWKVAEPLGYGRTYTIDAVDLNGLTSSVTFSTLMPAATQSVALAPIPDSTVGIGQAINFIFGSAPSDREAVQDAISIETSNDTVGAFYWVSANELRWRPEEFWEPGTEVTVEANIYGVDMGGGVYGSSDNATNFTIGEDVRAIVDDATKTMEVYRNGELLRSIPVSLGRDTAKWATPNGIYVVGDEHKQLLMDSATFGLAYDQGGYSTMVDYATQLSYSGIYVHAAPWSVGQQGYSNTSHGCINVTTEAAGWFQETVKRGDPVIVKNTVGGTLNAIDGLGHWNMDWQTWSAGNA